MPQEPTALTNEQIIDIAKRTLAATPDDGAKP